MRTSLVGNYNLVKTFGVPSWWLHSLHLVASCSVQTWLFSVLSETYFYMSQDLQTVDQRMCLCAHTVWRRPPLALWTQNSSCASIHTDQHCQVNLIIWLIIIYQDYGYSRHINAQWDQKSSLIPIKSQNCHKKSQCWQWQKGQNTQRITAGCVWGLTDKKVKVVDRASKFSKSQYSQAPMGQTKLFHSDPTPQPTAPWGARSAPAVQGEHKI